MDQISKTNLDHQLRLAILEGMTSQEIAPILEGVHPRQYAPGDFLFAPEDSMEHLFALEVGRVDVYRINLAGKRLIVRRIFPQTVFGVLGQSVHGCFAEAAEPCVVRIVTRGQLLELFGRRPDIAIRIIEVIGCRLRKTERMLEQAFYNPVKARLADFLLTNSDPSTGLLAGYTHEEIGDSIGALRQTVTETLRLMCLQGLLDVERRQIRVINREKLEQIACAGDKPLPNL